jgi:flagellar biosynthesis/type III secretory pathway protein FliH
LLNVNKGSKKGENTMRLTNLKKLTVAAAFGLVAMLGATQVADAQWNRDWQREQRRIEKQQRKAQRERQKYYRQQQRYQRQMYRVYTNGNYYQTDERGIQILRDAVNRGYQQGYYAGQTGRRNGYGYGYNGLSAYRNGTYGYNSYVNSSTYRYYFQQGFQRGYQDGYNSRYQYGYRSNNGLNILGSILSSILNFSRY